MKKLQIGVIHLAIWISLSACGLETTPTPTSALSATEPVISTLSGRVHIAGETPEPFITLLELRSKDTFWLVQSVIPDAGGRFVIQDIPPGDYELWVLITAATQMVSGCEDLWVSNDQWRIGISFMEGDPIIVKETSLAKAISRSQNFTAYGLQPTSFYAVSPDFTIVSEFDAEVEITLLCQQKQVSQLTSNPSDPPVALGEWRSWSQLGSGSQSPQVNPGGSAD